MTRPRNRTISSSPFPTPTPPPFSRRTGITTRGLRAFTPESNTHLSGPTDTTTTTTTPIPTTHTLPPTVPSPFTGTLTASLDAILHFGTLHLSTQPIITALLRPPSPGTPWLTLLRTIFFSPNGRLLLEEFLCLVTRTLLPEQIAQNRSAMARLYERKKQLAIRVVLRYDMLRGWKGDSVGVASLGPSEDMDMTAEMEVEGEKWDGMRRRRLMRNVIPTLIAAPPGGWTTQAVRERMKHHVTELDRYLLLSDEEIAAWSDETLLGMTAMVVMQWMWLRGNNEVLEEMEVGGYEELEGKADECEWVVDDVKRKGGRGVGGGGED